MNKMAKILRPLMELVRGGRANKKF